VPSGRVGVDIPLEFPEGIAIGQAALAEAGLVALLEEAVVESPELSIAEEIMTMELSGKASAFFLKSLVAMAAVAVELLSASTVVQT